MSYSITIERTVEEWHWSGLTYNLGPMLREGGVDLRVLDDVDPRSIIDQLRNLRTQMIAEPDRFRAHNPPNGWGDYDGCLRFVDEFTNELERAVREAKRDEDEWRVKIR